MKLIKSKINFEGNNDTSVSARDATHPLKWDLEDCSHEEIINVINNDLEILRGKYPEYKDFFYKEIWDGRATWYDLYGIEKGDNNV